MPVSDESHDFEPPLPDTSNLPSVFMFAEYIPSDTRRTCSLPSAALKTLGKKKTLGKDGVCRVSKEKHSAKIKFAECKKNTRQRNKIFFLEKKEKKKNEKKLCQVLRSRTLGKEILL